ncbi:energy-coupling factor transporter transmembrane component T family protein [Acidaminobacterium chupaoyuni]
MLKDITIGQYFPVESPVHRLDGRTKLILTFAYIVFLFLAKGVAAYGLFALSLVAVIKISHISFKMVAKSLKPIAFLAVFTALLNMLYTPGQVLWRFWIFQITQEGIVLAAFMVARIVMLIAATSLLTYTTSPVALTDSIETLFRPLNRLHVPVHEFAMMMTIALRFIPTLIEETEKIINAQKARGADFETGNIIRRAKALIPVLVPLFVSAFRRADELSVAMECRLYRGGAGRTRLKQLKMGKNDAAAFAICCVFFAAVMVVTKVWP